MSDQIDNLKELLNSMDSEDKKLALNLLQSGYFEFEEIKDIIYDYLKAYDGMSQATEEDRGLKSHILETIIVHSEKIVKGRRGSISFLFMTGGYVIAGIKLSEDEQDNE